MKPWCNLSCVLFVPQTCLHPLCRQFPPSVQFRKMFLTELIRRVGAQSDRVAGIHARLVRPPDCCRTAVNRRVSSWCRVSAAGGRRLWPPGRAVRRSGRSCRGCRHDRVLQELLTGTRKTLSILMEQKDILGPDSDVLVLVLVLFCPAAQWWSCQPAGERGPDLRRHHRPGDLGGGSLPGRVGSGSPGDLQRQVPTITWQSSWIAEDSSQNFLRSISKSSHLGLFQPVSAWSDRLASFEEKDGSFSSTTFPQ